jgi:hypothetical protein
MTRYSPSYQGTLRPDPWGKLCYVEEAVHSCARAYCLRFCASNGEPANAVCRRDDPCEEVEAILSVLEAAS